MVDKQAAENLQEGAGDPVAATAAQGAGTAAVRTAEVLRIAGSAILLWLPRQVEVHILVRSQAVHR